MQGTHFEGLELARGEDGYIRGSKKRKVADTFTKTKYDALFEDDEIFDPLKESFLVFGDDNMSQCDFRCKSTGRLRRESD